MNDDILFRLEDIGTNDIVERFTDISRRDDCFDHMVPSDVRLMLRHITRLRSERDEQAKIIVAMRDAWTAARKTLPPDRDLNAPWSQAIAIMDDACDLSPDALADMRLVPREPTEAMVKAGAQALYSWRPIADKPEIGAERVYHAMIGEIGHE